MALAGVGVNFLIPSRAFGYVVGVASGLALWVWGMTVVAHLRYRRLVDTGAVESSGFRMPGTPFTDWVVLLVLAAAFVGMAVDADGWAVLVVALALSLLAVAAFWTQSRTSHPGSPRALS